MAAGASWWDRTGTAEIRAAMTGIPSPQVKSEVISPNPLTQREQEILVLIAAGKTNQEIAERLHIATGTVRVHVHAILQKLEVRDRTQAAVLAIQKGLVAPELLASRGAGDNCRRI